ncbi:MAG: twin-arginine translocation signal domain-containing protein, partial [Tannerella sp.]|nr:twin-arginine translocation signal domain-containing protein [Tannerella sp.]
MKSNRRDFLKKTLYGGLALGVTGSYAGAAQR